MKKGEVTSHIFYNEGKLAMDVRSCQKTATVNAVHSLIVDNLPVNTPLKVEFEDLDATKTVIVITHVFDSTRLERAHVVKVGNALLDSMRIVEMLCEAYERSLAGWKDVAGSMMTPIGPATDGEAQNQK